MIKNVTSLSKVFVILVRFEYKSWIYSTDFRKILKY